ncbi:MAG TPA: type II secretion system protein [Phycisphaerae bacterium]|nr:type II secretion system protein [Phycisphaerae bacterium]
MTDKRKAFTLVELMLVILIIGIVMALLMKAGPDVVRNIKIMQTKNFLMTLEMGCQRYKEVFGSFPPDGAELPYEGGSLWSKALDSYSKHWPTASNGSYRGRVYRYVYVALQGPDGFGWSRSEHEVSADFGPILESGSSHLGESRIGDIYGAAFLDAFNRPIIYMKAHTNPRLFTDHLDSETGRPNPRYCGSMLYTVWGGQNGIGGWENGNMYGVYHDHWKKKMAMRYAPDAKGVMRYYPHNPDSFVLWSSGPDEKFGYWIYDKENNGYDFIRSVNKLHEGTCDDITNF